MDGHFSDQAAREGTEKAASSSNNEPIFDPNRREIRNDDANENHATHSGPTDEGQEEALNENRIVKHIMVIGFHHKHGYQVDYCYPPLTPNGPVFSTHAKPISLPSCWKTLPLLCLPDGSHNYDSDTIYFTMPDNLQLERDTNQTGVGANTCDSNSNPPKSGTGIKTIFGTACYRQVQADKLLNRTDDVTRVAVQKSVCILSTKPLFGLIRSKLEMITHAYFEELDFSKVKILKLTYNNLNSLLSRDSVKDNSTFLGLSVRHLVSQFGCNVLVLFKAMLLEKRILFYKSPVRDLCSTIMSMCSLFTGLLECGGLDHSTCDLQLSPNLLESLKLLTPPTFEEDNSCDDTKIETASKESKVLFKPSEEEIIIINEVNSSDKLIEEADLNDSITNASQPSELSHTSTILHPKESRQMKDEKQVTPSEVEQSDDFEVIAENKLPKADEDETEGYVSLADGSIVDDPHALKLCRMKPEDCGLPLQIFTRGSFCLPYLSISYLDILSDTRVKSFVIGATNFLFKQRREIYDVIVDMEENTITINNANLKKCLSLSTEDLRFMDYLSRHVKMDGPPERIGEFDLISHEITNWVGGDEWIRYQFRLYTLHLLKASKCSTGFEPFNINFIQAWKQETNNYRIWDLCGKSSILDGMQNKHPFSNETKGINFNDMKLKISYAVNSSEKGRIINQTLNGIGKWSIWNNIASAAVAASSASTSTITSALSSSLTSGTKTTSTKATTSPSRITE